MSPYQFRFPLLRFVALETSLMLSQIRYPPIKLNVEWTKEYFVFLFKYILLKLVSSRQSRVVVLFFRKFSFFLLNPLLDFFLRWMPKHIPYVDVSPKNGTIFWIKGVWPKFRVCWTLTKPSTIGPFSNDLQVDHSLTRSVYGRLQNQVSAARGILCALLHLCIYLCFLPSYNFTYINNFVSMINLTEWFLMHRHNIK